MKKLLPFALLMIAAVPAMAATEFENAQFQECLKQAERDPQTAIATAIRWASQKPSYLAKACHGIALAAEGQYTPALDMLSEAAQAAEAAKDQRAAGFWAQAGNAAYAEGLPDSALIALDKAIALGGSGGGLPEKERGDVEVDRALVLVSLGREANAVEALANARALAPENGMAWLLSATLSRRTGNLEQAYEQIKTAAALLPKDAAVALEAGNIASAAGDEATARTQWEQVIRIAPDSAQAKTAKARLAEGTPTP